MQTPTCTFADLTKKVTLEHIVQYNIKWVWPKILIGLHVQLRPEHCHYTLGQNRAEGKLHLVLWWCGSLFFYN